MNLEQLEWLCVALQLCRSALGRGVGGMSGFIKVGVLLGEFDGRGEEWGSCKENTGAQESNPGAIHRILAG